MEVRTQVLGNIRERLREVRERIRERIGARGRVGERAQIQVGKGALIERARKRASMVTERLQEIRPGIIPKMGEVLSEWYPGKRLVKVISPKTELQETPELSEKPPEKKIKVAEKEGILY